MLTLFILCNYNKLDLVFIEYDNILLFLMREREREREIERGILVWSHSRIFQSYGDVTITCEGLQHMANV